MQTWDAITSRRNVRSFADRPIPAAELDQILEAGRRAPSSQNWQPWDPHASSESHSASPDSELGEFVARGGGVGVTGAEDAGAVGDHLAVELLGFGTAALADGQPGQGGTRGQGVRVVVAEQPAPVLQDLVA